MKVRILSNSLRYRLKQPEVNHFHLYGKVAEKMEFGSEDNDQITFSLEMSSDSQFAVSLQSNTITVWVPKLLAQEWTSTDLVGFNGKIDTGKGRIIDVLVEKDFKCLDPREEDNEGSYPNPLAGNEQSGW